MANTAISIENISKSYQLGTIGTGTFYGDLNRWWAQKRGRPDPYRKIGEVDHGNRQGETLWALEDVNFQVQQGEAVGIIGRNGAGKSTLLKVLSRVTAPTGGLMKVKGRIASLLEVGTGFHPELTGRENIFLNGAIMGMNKDEIRRKFDEIVDFSGVEKFIDTPVKRYSSGMYVRLAFAVAAHLEPEILIVDEVLSVGDAEFQKKCLGKMDDVTKTEGRTVLFVSHNMGAINKLCTRSVLLEKGRVFSNGETSKVVSLYYQRMFDNEVPDSYTPSSTGRISFDKVYFQNDAGDRIQIANTLKPIRVIFDYTLDLGTSPDDMLMNFAFINDIGQRLFTCPVEFSKKQVSGMPSSGSLVCEIPSLSLSPGTYQIQFSCRFKGFVDDKAKGYSILAVSNDNAASLVNLSENKYQDLLYGTFLVDYKWAVNPISG